MLISISHHGMSVDEVGNVNTIREWIRVKKNIALKIIIETFKACVEDVYLMREDFSFFFFRKGELNLLACACEHIIN